MKTVNKTITGIILISFLFINNTVTAQVGIGTTNPDVSSMLDIQSTSKGILIPRMQTSDRTSILSPVTGLLVFDTDTQSFWFYKVSWTELVDGASDKIVDANGDTKIELEHSADEDKIRLSTAGSERMTIDSSGNTRIGDGTNNTYIESDGSLSYEGTATRWDDLKVPVNSVKIKGTVDEAKWDTFLGNTALLWFENNKSQDVVFTVQMPHAWKQGTAIMPHVHWTTGRNGVGPAPGSNTVTWNLEYTWANVGEVFSAPSGTNTGSAVAAPNTGAGHIALNEHVITPLGSIVATTKTLSSMLVCRLYRSASDSYSGDAGLLEIDFHFEIDSDGSRSEYTK